jgi:NAD(P)-dependent dehydrogenase (short-subunit alcohol dehydrogenase family)
MHQVRIVTGGSQGIGEAVARLPAANRAPVLPLFIQAAPRYGNRRVMP